VVHSSETLEELMDQALVHFRKAAARENRERRSVRRRYSTALQQQAVDYCLARRQHGDGVRDVAAALGVAPWSLHRWMRTWATRGRFHEVPMTASAAPMAVAAPVIILSADGLRVEGLDIDAAAQLLRLLR
jgi:transposase-like protein